MPKYGKIDFKYAERLATTPANEDGPSGWLTS